MKRILLILTLLVAVLGGCKKKDERAERIERKLRGLEALARCMEENSATVDVNAVDIDLCNKDGMNDITIEFGTTGDGIDPNLD